MGNAVGSETVEAGGKDASPIVSDVEDEKLLMWFGSASGVQTSTLVVEDV
jgi:hypothetical protein